MYWTKVTALVQAKKPCTLSVSAPYWSTSVDLIVLVYGLRGCAVSRYSVLARPTLPPILLKNRVSNLHLLACLIFRKTVFFTS